jgi:hypothetical protein
MARYRYRVPLESGPRLDINNLIRRKLLIHGARTVFGLQWTDGSRASLEADLGPEARQLLAIEHDDGTQVIGLASVPANFGGRKWFFLCPRTYRRVSVLWKPPGSPYFAARQAFGRQVAYGSQFEAPRDRAISKARAIRKRLGGGDDLFDNFPEKPLRMRRRAYERLASLDEQYQAATAAWTMMALARFEL